MRNAALTVAAATALVGITRLTQAALTGPYSVDPNTLHLYHLNESALPAVDATGLQNMAGPTSNTTTTTPAGFQAPIFGAPAFTGFGTSFDFSNDTHSIVSSGNPPPVSPHRPVLTAAAGLSNAGLDNVTLDWAGADGAFTIEAMIKFNADFINPTSNTFRTAAPTASPGTNAGQYPMEIVSGEGETNGPRLFQFRIDQPDNGGNNQIASTGATTDNDHPRLEFANLRGIVSNQGIILNLPETGPHAINNTDWFHVAVSYDGNAGVAGNIGFYWTKVDEAFTEANLIATATLNLDPVEGLTGFAIGNETRDTGTGAGEGESFPGFIDEVRISGVGRTAGQFIFVPEPGTLGLLAIGALVSLRRRR